MIGFWTAVIALALIGVVALAAQFRLWLYRRMSKAEKDAAYRAVQQTRPWWPDEEEKPHVR